MAIGTERGAADDLRRIPGVGPAMAGDLRALGFGRVVELRGHDPTALYERLRVLAGGRLDRCVLYVLRCAIYFASVENPRGDLLKWWNWQDKARSSWRHHAPWPGDDES